MKKYCFDTSGISNPLESMPEDIHESAWTKIKVCIESGMFAVTTEIYDEMTNITGTVGGCIRANAAALVLEIGEGEWDWDGYVGHVTRMQDEHRQFISDFNNNRKGTICLTDLSIIALAKTLKLPVVSMETAVRNAASLKRRIPDICHLSPAVIWRSAALRTRYGVLAPSRIGVRRGSRHLVRCVVPHL
jgi:Domain of unknown function (DUF4411)